MASGHVGIGVGAGLYFYTSSLFVVPASETFGWTRGEISAAAALGLLGSLSAPLIGRLADRYGARIVAGISMIAIGLVFVALSQVSGPYWQFVVLSALFGIVAPGATALTFSRVVTGWFDRAKGQALGIMAAGGSIGALLITPLVAYMLASHGIMGGYLTLAALAIFLGAPVILIFMRDRSDDEEPTTEEPAGSEADPAPKRLVWATIRSRSFYALAVSVFCTNVPTSGVLTQLEPLLLFNGVTSTAPLISLYAVVVLIGRVGIGWLFDRGDARYIAASVTLIAATGCLMFLSGAPGWMTIAAVILVGLMQGMEVDAIGYFVAQQFPRETFGLLFGLLLTISLLGTALGIVGFGMLYDATQSYDLPLTIAACVMAVAFFSYLAIPARRA
ncbi:MFS transporter [Alteriqipengyuania lutimaris]|uniref:MFS transporter n=1 Tax=Alteriqipengyuania lutimaris TaxID=1538146 RepID=UPI001CFD88B9|nr:MFS transporter [Alteriqipengyuania lutimaris]